MSVFVPVPCAFGSCGFTVCSEVRECGSSTSVLFLKIVLAVSNRIRFLDYKIRKFTEL